MSPVDSGFPHDSGVKRRMLPSVTDVVRDLARVVSADPAVLFKASRSVVAEELAKVKQGFEAAPLDVLVKRARLQLERDGEATPVSDPSPPPMPVFPARSPSGVTAKRPASDDPFQDVASRADLNWEKEIPIQPEDAPFRSAIIPIPRKARGPLEISTPIDAPSRAAPEPKAQPTPAPKRKPQPELELDFAQAMRAQAPSEPPAPAAPEPPAPRPKPALPESAPAASEPLAPEPIAPPRELAPEKPMLRPAIASAPAIPLVNPREAEIPEAGPERFLRAPAPPAHEPAVTPSAEVPPPAETPEDRDSTQPAMEEFRFKAAERSVPKPAPARSSRGGWIAALLGVLAIGGGLTWAVREGVFKSDVLRSAAPAAKKPDVAPAESAVPAPVPAATTAPPAVAKPMAPAEKPLPAPGKPAAAGPPSGAAVPKGRAAVLLTPDWTGKPVVYVIHFSSTKDRESAAKEAQKLGAALGAPARAVEVDLGEKGIWYRVVIGEFADVDAARAFRADLEAKKTPGMGFVYEMRGR